MAKSDGHTSTTSSASSSRLRGALPSVTHSLAKLPTMSSLPNDMLHYNSAPHSRAMVGVFRSKQDHNKASPHSVLMTCVGRLAPRQMKIHISQCGGSKMVGKPNHATVIKAFYSRCICLVVSSVHHVTVRFARSRSSYIICAERCTGFKLYYLLGCFRRH